MICLSSAIIKPTYRGGEANLQLPETKAKGRLQNQARPEIKPTNNQSTLNQPSETQTTYAKPKETPQKENQPTEYKSTEDWPTVGQGLNHSTSKQANRNQTQYS